MTQKSGMLTAIESHWPKIAMAGALAYGGYVTGQVRTDTKIETISISLDRVEGKVDALDRRISRREQPIQCAQRNFDKLFDRHGERPACEMAVPE